MRGTFYLPAGLAGDLRRVLYVRLSLVAQDIEERACLAPWLREEGWQHGLRSRLERVMSLLDALDWEERSRWPAVVAVDMHAHGRELIETLSFELSATRDTRSQSASRVERLAIARHILELRVLLYAAQLVLASRPFNR
jgi:hypothetical protein